jgi:hypothetical protein
MKRPLIVDYIPDGTFSFVDVDETGNWKPPAYGPLSKEEALFQLAAVYGFTDYRKARQLLTRPELAHSAKSD